MSTPTEPVVVVVDMSDIVEGLRKKKFGEEISNLDPTELICQLAGATDEMIDDFVDIISNEHAGPEETQASFDDYAQMAGSTYGLYGAIKDKLSEINGVRPYADKVVGEVVMRGKIAYVRYEPDKPDPG